MAKTEKHKIDDVVLVQLPQEGKGEPSGSPSDDVETIEDDEKPEDEEEGEGAEGKEEGEEEEEKKGNGKPQPNGDGEDEGEGDEQEGDGTGGQDQLDQMADALTDAMENRQQSCGGRSKGNERQGGEMDFQDELDANQALEEIEEAMESKASGEHPFKKGGGKGRGEGYTTATGEEVELVIPERKKIPKWISLVREFAEQEFEKQKGKKEFDAPHSFGMGFVQRGKVKGVKFKKHMYILVDVSGSMMWGTMGTGKSLLEQLLAFVPKLTKDYSTEIWFVSNGLLTLDDGEPAIFTPRELRDMNTTEFMKWLGEAGERSVGWGGGTAFKEPFEMMVAKREEEGHGGVMLVLTDGYIESTLKLPPNMIFVTDADGKKHLLQDNMYGKQVTADKTIHVVDADTES